MDVARRRASRGGQDGKEFIQKRPLAVCVYGKLTMVGDSVTPWYLMVDG
jgi:hypothetical protein